MSRYFIILGLLFSQIYLSGQIKIVVLGSSTAAGTGPSHIDSSWVNRYRKYVKNINPDHEVINLARGGYTTYHVLPTGTAPVSGRPSVDVERNIDAALSNNPDAIIINLPSNDAAKGYSVMEQIENYRKLLVLSNANEVPVWIATPQGRNLNMEGKINLIEMKDSTFAIFGEKAIDFWKYIGQSNGSLNSLYNSGDGVHLNDKGHKLLFKRVVEKNILGVLSGTEVVTLGKKMLSIYPNPTSDVLMLKFEEGYDISDIKEITIHDVNGKFVTRLIVDQKQELEIDVHHLSNGIYTLKVRLDKNVFGYKFVKCNRR